MAESDMLSALLNDPHALEQALSTASALLGGSDPPAMPPMSEPSGMPSASPSASANDGYDPSVNLNRRDLLSTLRQLDGQAAHTRTDFHRTAVFIHTALSRDALGHPLLGQEVLSERFGKAKAVTG